MTSDPRPLAGKVALVAGGTRGGGRGIAVELGAAGATVYVTGRSSGARRSDLDRPETIEQTADAVSAAGGRGIPVRADHSRPDDVSGLIGRIAAEQSGQLDILVNCVWGGDPLTDWEHPLWEQELEAGLRLIRQAVETHVITSRLALPLLVARKSGLVVEVTDGNTARYRGSFFYDLAKSAVIRLAVAQAAELKPHGIAAVAITPGFLRSEAMLENFGVTEANWRGGAAADPDFAYSESPAYLGRAVAALAADPDVIAKTGRALATWGLYREYGFTDADGTQPDWAAHWDSALARTHGPLGDPLLRPSVAPRGSPSHTEVMAVGGNTAYASITDLPPLVTAAVELAASQSFDYSCDPAQGRLLSVLAGGWAGGRIGETGTGCGVGLAWMLEATDESTSITSVELDPGRAAASAALFAGRPNVRVLAGNWTELREHGPFDLLVLDGGGKGKEPEDDPPLDPTDGWLAVGGTIVLDDFIPFDRPGASAHDHARRYWLGHPALQATELRLSPTLATLVGVRMR